MRRKEDQDRWQEKMKAENEILKEDLITSRMTAREDLITSRMTARMEADEVTRLSMVVIPGMKSKNEALCAEVEDLKIALAAAREETLQEQRDRDEEAWRHTTCLSIAEGMPSWDKEDPKTDSPAMVAVRGLRREVERLRQLELEHENLRFALDRANDELVELRAAEPKTMTSTDELRIDPSATVTLKDGQIVAVESPNDQSPIDLLTQPENYAKIVMGEMDPLDILQKARARAQELYDEIKKSSAEVSFNRPKKAPEESKP